MRDAAFFGAVFIAVLAVGIQLSAAQSLPGQFGVCSNSNEFLLTRGQVLTLTPGQLNPACPIMMIQAAVLGHVPGGAAPQVAENAVKMTYSGPAVELRYGEVGEITGNPDETPITIAPNTIVIFGPTP